QQGHARTSHVAVSSAPRRRSHVPELPRQHGVEFRLLPRQPLLRTTLLEGALPRRHTARVPPCAARASLNAHPSESMSVRDQTPCRAGGGARVVEAIEQLVPAARAPARIQSALRAPLLVRAPAAPQSQRGTEPEANGSKLASRNPRHRRLRRLELI